MPRLFRADLLAVLFARNPLPRLLQAGRAAREPDRRLGRAHLPRRVVEAMNTDISQYVGVLLLFAAIIGAVLAFVYFQVSFESNVQQDILKSTLWTVFFILSIIAAIAAWVFVLVHESRRVAEEETQRQTELLMQEIEAHKRTDAKLQQAKESAEAASKAKSRYVVGLSHELRTPLNAVVGYAQILERDPAIPLAPPRCDPGGPPQRRVPVGPDRRPARYLQDRGRPLRSQPQRGPSARIPRPARRHVPPAGRRQGHRIRFRARRPDLPAAVYTDENRLRQILINLLSNAIKFTDEGASTMRVALPQPGRQLRNRGHRHRHPCRGPRAHLPAVRARPSRAAPTPGRYRARPHHHQDARRDDGRRDHRAQRPRQGQRVPGQAAALRGAAAAHRPAARAPRLRL